MVGRDPELFQFIVHLIHTTRPHVGQELLGGVGGAEAVEAHVQLSSPELDLYDINPNYMQVLMFRTSYV